MNEQSEVTIHVKETHECGQVLEQITHIKVGPAFSYTLTSDPPLMPFADVKQSPVWPAPVVTEIKTLLELSGHVSKVEINGAEIREKQFVCSKCGADLLFPGQCKE
jgi:hypothetical protein